MMKRSLALLLTVAAAGCGGPARGPAPQPTVVTPLMLQPPPIYSLLGFRDKINLTSQQITQLDSLAMAVHDENSELTDSLKAVAIQTRDGSALVVQDSVGRDVLRQIQQNNRHAADAAGQILTAEQRTTACDVFGQQEADRDRMRKTMADRMRSDASMSRSERMAEADSIMARYSGGWPWCRTDTAKAKKE